MQPTEASTASPQLSDFAGLLARLAEAAEKAEPEPPDNELADDVAHITYESALRAQRGDSVARSQAARLDSTFVPARIQDPVRKSPAESHERKETSVTIRMTRVECEQLHERAAEAGMTVSAYLRSCVLEVEDLRAQVKKALAELRVEQPASHPDARKTRPAMRFWPFVRP